MPTWDLGLRATWQNEDAKVLQALDELKQLNSEIEKSQQGHADAANAAQKHADALDGLAGKVAGLIAAYTGINLVWQSFKEGTQEFMVQERALNAISNTAKQFGQDGKEAAESAHALAHGLEAVGFNEAEVLQGTQRLMVVTRDHAQAISAASLAADLAIKTGNDYGSMLTIIQALLTNSPRGLLMAHRQLGIEATDAADALAKISAMARGASAELKDTTAAAAAFSTVITEHWKDIGRIAASVWAPLARFAVDYQKKQEDAQIELTYKFKKMIGSTEDADAWYAEALKKWKEKFGIPLGEAMAKLTPAKDDTLKNLGKSMSEALKKLGEDVDADVKKENEAEKKREKALEEWSAAADETAHTINKSEETRLKLDEERRKKRLKGILADKAEEERIEKEGDKKIEAFGNALFNAGEQLSAKQLEHLIARMQKALAEERMTDQQRLQLKKQIAAAESQLDLAVADLKVKTDLQALAVLGQAATAAFEGNKTVAVADAIISTYVAASHAAETKPFLPLGLAMTILALAQGFGRVKQIESTTVGSSSGGGAAASPSVSVPTSVYTGPAAPAASTTTVHSTVNEPSNITINTLTGDGAVATARQVQRILRPGSRAYDRGIVTRAATTVGSRR